MCVVSAWLSPFLTCTIATLSLPQRESPLTPYSVPVLPPHPIGTHSRQDCRFFGAKWDPTFLLSSASSISSPPPLSSSSSSFVQDDRKDLQDWPDPARLSLHYIRLSDGFCPLKKTKGEKRDRERDRKMSRHPQKQQKPSMVHSKCILDLAHPNLGHKDETANLFSVRTRLLE